MRGLRKTLLATLLLLAVAPTLGRLRADEAADRFFETRIRPVLAERCFECHGEDAAESELRLDSRAAMLKGGSRGPAVVPGEAAKSLIWRAMSHGEQLQMPPKKKLPAAVIADVAAWIKQGANWPAAVEPAPGNSPTTPADSSVAATEIAKQIAADRAAYWAFFPPQPAPLPAAQNANWVQSPIDAFVLARLEAAGLQPAPPADRRTLIRRATFDLTGLPPTPAEVETFLADESPEAFARAIDRLLASPRYGERWGRHWLDVARYADSNGLDENLAYANAFRYRDYAIGAFNADKPYDGFIREQLAGDLWPASALPPGDGDNEAERLDRLIATGFLSLGAKMLAEDDQMKVRMDIIDEQLDTIGRTFLGLTLGCARCHDHKFDPIRMSDYYGLAGILFSTKTMENFSVVARWREQPVANAEQLQANQAAQQLVAAKAAEIELAKAANPPATADQLKELEEQKKALEKQVPPLPEAMIVADDSPQNLRIHLRGSHFTLGDEVPRRFPLALTAAPAETASASTATTIAPDRSGRWELAEWLIDRQNPLTARVMVNRIWQGHFGEGLVRSPDNFGRLGERPTHPELLDWLAIQFVESGWSIKALHRTIMLSATYQMSSRFDERATEIDPENRLWWHMPRRRLEAEAIRDAILAVSGRLDERMGGSLLPTPNRNYVTSTASVNPVVYDPPRRSVYLPVVRSALFEVLTAFDFPDPAVVTARRESTTVAPQALFMMNSQIVAENARAWSERLLASEPTDDAARVRAAYLAAFGRPPSHTETAAALQYVRDFAASLAAQQPDEPSRTAAAWKSLCRVLLAANEFIYLD